MVAAEIFNQKLKSENHHQDPTSYYHFPTPPTITTSVFLRDRALEDNLIIKERVHHNFA